MILCDLEREIVTLFGDLFLLSCAQQKASLVQWHFPKMRCNPIELLPNRHNNKHLFSVYKRNTRSTPEKSPPEVFSSLFNERVFGSVNETGLISFMNKICQFVQAWMNEWPCSRPKFSSFIQWVSRWWLLIVSSVTTFKHEFPFVHNIPRSVMGTEHYRLVPQSGQMINFNTK